VLNLALAEIGDDDERAHLQLLVQGLLEQGPA